MVHDVPILGDLVFSAFLSHMNLPHLNLIFRLNIGTWRLDVCPSNNLCRWETGFTKLINLHILWRDISLNYVCHTRLKVWTFITWWASLSDLGCFVLDCSSGSTQPPNLSMIRLVILLIHLWRAAFQHTKLLESRISWRILTISIISLSRWLRTTFILTRLAAATVLFLRSGNLTSDDFGFVVWVRLHNEIGCLWQYRRLHNVLL